MRKLTVRTIVAVITLTVIASGCAGLGSGPTDQELVAALMTNWKTALEAQDLDAIMDLHSEDFVGRDGAGKEQVREFLEGAIDQGYLEDVEVVLEEAETIIEGDTATVAPVLLSAPLGEMELDLELAKESDGTWRVIASDGR